MQPTILIASKNKDKINEISAILADLDIHISTLSSFSDINPPAETGKTFRENALIKARYYHQHSGLPVIADDSGLVVPALNGEPGVYSARYAGKHAGYKENNRKLVKKMTKKSGLERKAYFVAFMVYFDGKNCVEAEGRIEGMISVSERGAGGFGYDPLFIVPHLNKTFAEIERQEKNRISHRARALTILHKKLKNTLDLQVISQVAPES